MRGWILALITAAQVLEHFSALVGTDQDTLLVKLVARLDQLAAAWCSLPLTDTNVHTLESATYTVYPKPRHNNPAVLDLPHPLVTAVTTAHVDPSWAYGSETELVAGDRLLDTRSRELWRKPLATGPTWSTAPRANKLVLVAGFSAGAPAELIPVIAFGVRHLLDLDRTIGQGSLSQAGQTFTFTDANTILPASVKEALGPWVHWRGRVG